MTAYLLRAGVYNGLRLRHDVTLEISRASNTGDVLLFHAQTRTRGEGGSESEAAKDWLLGLWDDLGALREFAWMLGPDARRMAFDLDALVTPSTRPMAKP